MNQQASIRVETVMGNISVPTSYMCAHSDYDFVGRYDAVLHIDSAHQGAILHKKLLK